MSTKLSHRCDNNSIILHRLLTPLLVVLAACAPAADATAGTVPAELLNPRVTQATIATTVCRKGWSASVRPSNAYTAALKRHQIAVYGYADTRPSSYEMDHVVSLELGGSPTAPANFFPEPLAVSHRDDVLENSLNRDVCARRRTLADAQARVLAAKVAHGYDRAKSVA